MPQMQVTQFGRVRSEAAVQLKPGLQHRSIFCSDWQHGSVKTTFQSPTNMMCRKKTWTYIPIQLTDLLRKTATLYLLMTSLKEAHISPNTPFNFPQLLHCSLTVMMRCCVSGLLPVGTRPLLTFLTKFTNGKKELSISGWLKPKH